MREAPTVKQPTYYSRVSGRSMSRAHRQRLSVNTPLDLAEAEEGPDEDDDLETAVEFVAAGLAGTVMAQSLRVPAALCSVCSCPRTEHHHNCILNESAGVR